MATTFPTRESERRMTDDNDWPEEPELERTAEMPTVNDDLNGHAGPHNPPWWERVNINAID